MQLVPRNRYILVDLIEDIPTVAAKKPTILLPEDYKPTGNPFATARVRDSAPNCNIALSPGDIVVIPKSMIEDVEVGESKFKLVLENHILGVVEE